MLLELEIEPSREGLRRAFGEVRNFLAPYESRPEWKLLEPGTWYTLPFGALVARGFGNLLVAGRCLSAVGGGFASARVIGPCMLGGQAVAVAAREMVRRGARAQDLDAGMLREELARLGVPL